MELRRLRLRRAGGEHFADVVIGVAPGAAIGQGHAAADRVERALHDALPGIDVVVHVEPRRGDGGIRERALAAALTVSHVREIHNLTVLDVDGSIEVSLHLKLPGDLPLDEAHDIAEQVEAAILAQVPEVRTVQTHIEPLKETASGEEVAIDTAAIEAAVREETGAEPRELRFVRTDDGIVAFLTLGLGSAGSVADAHGRATRDRGTRARRRPGDRRRRGAHRAVMRLCMFHPVGHPMERGWVGRVDGDRVVHLAAQTLQSFFSGGGSAREHAEYPLAEVQLLAPVLHPPSIRVFDDESSFAFANPAAIRAPGSEIAGDVALVLAPRIAALIGAEGAVAGFTILAEWRDPARRPPKDRDFALGLGPVVVTTDAFEPGACVQVVLVDGAEVARLPVAVFDWAAATAFAAERTRLYPGDLLAGPSCGLVDGIAPGSVVEVGVDGIGALELRIAP